jgi:hypothetical protein
MEEIKALKCYCGGTPEYRVNHADGVQYWRGIIRCLKCDAHQDSHSKIGMEDALDQLLTQWNETMRPGKVIAIDFDGVIVEDKYPDIGQTVQRTVEFIEQARENGYRFILWTCRNGDKLEEALERCRAERIVFAAVNENLPEHIAEYGGDTRKVFADFYIDDKNYSLPLLGLWRMNTDG